MNQGIGARCHNNSAVAGARKSGEVTLNFSRVTYVNRSSFYCLCRRSGLDNGKLADAGGSCGVPDHRYALNVWTYFSKKLQPFAANAIFELCETRGIGAR